MAMVLNFETQEYIENLKQDLSKIGITIIGITLTKLDGGSAWLFHFQGSSRALENYLQSEAENQGIYYSCQVGHCNGQSIYYATFIIG